MTTDHERIRLDDRRRQATKPRRRVKPAQAAAEARARAQALADRWDHAPPRRPLFGHGPDCPHRLAGPMRRCPWCRAEALAGPAINGIAVPATSALAPRQRRAHPDTPTQPSDAASGPTAPVERACAGPGCWRPTDHHSGLCDRCRTEGATA